MKNNKLLIFYIVLCLCISISPFAFMISYKTDNTSENRELASFPGIVSENKLNTAFLSQLGEYFEDRFAFRKELVTADSLIQKVLFHSTSNNKVVVGKNNWLFYNSTLDDYMGNNVISDRTAFNIANNISIISEYVKKKGADFIFTVAPNKNSLYSQNMPDYIHKTAKDKNIDKVQPLLEKLNIPYVDLFSAFKSQDKILYYESDSHWTNDGAVLAYNTILDYANKQHNNYDNTNIVRNKSYVGDLNKMLFPVSIEKEWESEYEYQSNFSYTTDTISVENAIIETNNSKATGNLLMFRDSFGNSLLPLMAESYNTACFSKGVPYSLEEYIEKYQPDTVICEKVERNIEDYSNEPALISAPKIEIESNSVLDSDTEVELSECDNNTDYIQISGFVQSDFIGNNEKIYVSVQDVKYEAFTVTVNNNDCGFLLYLKKSELQSNTIEINIYVDKNSNVTCVKSATLELV